VQNPCSFDGLLPGLLTHSRVGKVLFLLLQELALGGEDLQVIAGSFHLAMHPHQTFPQELDIALITQVVLIAGGIFQNNDGLFQIQLSRFDHYILDFSDVQLLAISVRTRLKFFISANFPRFR
jgi:hypothetical protein